MTPNPVIIQRAIKKAMKSDCNYLVSAIGLNRRGEVIFSSPNLHRFNHYGGSIHAEMNVMLKAGPSLHTIVIVRVTPKGTVKPLHSCDACSRKAKELGVKILSVSDLRRR